MLMDTALEKEIGIGTNYPFPPLGSGECVISVEEIKVLNVTNGSMVHMETYMVTMLNAIIDNYNSQTDNPVHNMTNNITTNLTCKIVGFMDTTYEKYPEFPSQVIMEYS